jgi:hypothetical protein
MQNIKTKSLIDVGGVIFTDEALSILKIYQDEHNGHIDALRNTMADLVCFLSRLWYNLDPEQQQDAIGFMEFLSTMRIDLNKLSKP